MPVLIRACAVTALVPATLSGKMDLPMVLLESLALERPVLVTDRAPMNEAVLDGGLTVGYGDVAATCAALERLLRLPDEAAVLARAGAARLRAGGSSGAGRSRHRRGLCERSRPPRDRDGIRMTTTRAGAQPATARAAAGFDRAARRLVEVLATPAGLAATAFLVALALRLVFVDRAWDIFVDEITYLAIARNIAEGRGLTLYGAPFFLHPPAFMIVEGAITSLTGLPAHLVDQVQAVRVINVVLGSIAASAIFLLARRVAGTPAGVLAALFYGIDAFVIRTNSRNYLETFALLWIILGYLVLLGGREDLDRLGRRRAAAAGMAFGVAFLTKDMTFFLSMAPLGLAFLWGRVLPRRRAVLAA